MAEYELSRAEFLAATWYMQRHFRRLLFGLALVAAAFVTIGFWQSDHWYPVAVAAIVFTATIALRLFLNRRKTLRIYDDHLAGRGGSTLEADDEKLVISLAGSTAELPWSRLKFWSENEPFLFVYQGKDYAHIIPKRALSSDEESLIRSKVAGLKKI